MYYRLILKGLTISVSEDIGHISSKVETILTNIRNMQENAPSFAGERPFFPTDSVTAADAADSATAADTGGAARRRPLAVLLLEYM